MTEQVYDSSGKFIGWKGANGKLYRRKLMAERYGLTEARK